MKHLMSGRPFALLMACLAFSLTSCLTSKKVDRFVAAQYNNELPKQSRKQQPGILVASTMPQGSTEISTTVHKFDKILPLLFYWHMRESHNVSLNSTIAQMNISNAINNAAAKGLAQKLNGQKLELTLEQAPAAFSLVDKSQMIWFIYGVSWSRVYVHPDPKDLVVSYKLHQSDSTLKTGTITIRNTQTDKNLRFFQTWKSAISEHVQQYNSNLTLMAKSLVTKLEEEI